jgi:basic membrane lipoprotein Med (substrate-binding protein (PBP1-ABC) superfamily)
MQQNWLQRVWMMVLIGGLLAACMSAPGPTPTPRADYRIGLITGSGTVRDGTFNEFAHHGAARAAADFNLAYTYRESVDETHYAIHLADLLADERSVIVTVGFMMHDFTQAQAAAHPDVYFIGVDQVFDAAPPNLVGLQFREDQGGFLAGALAGMMTESGTVAVLGGEAMPRWSALSTAMLTVYNIPTRRPVCWRRMQAVLWMRQPASRSHAAGLKISRWM